MKVVKEGNVPIKMWVTDIEEGAMAQARNLSNFPFIYRHVALMPDCHQGFGMPIGGVIATNGVVIPNAVGVDIGCFTGDTKVKLTDGRDLTFLELIAEDKNGKKNFCYSLDEKNNVVIGEISNPRRTKEVDTLIEITLDTGETVNCTSDHIFYTRDGKEILAKDISVGLSLMPLYIKKAREVDLRLRSYGDKRNKLSEYLVVYNPNTGLWDYIHFLADGFNLENNLYVAEKNRAIRHHKDFNKYNNDPPNIERHTWRSHWKIHSDNVRLTNRLGLTGFKKAWKTNRQLFSQMSSDKMTKLHQDPEFCKRRDMRASKTFKSYDRSDEFKEMVKSNGQRGKRFLVAYNKSEKGKKTSSDVAHRVRPCRSCRLSVVGELGLYNHLQKHHPVEQRCEKCLRPFKNKKAVTTHKRYCKNHKVSKLKLVKIKMQDVYCLTVDKHHNFALSSGVFVHNCGMCATKTKFKTSEVTVDLLKKMMGGIREVVPLGFKHHDKVQDESRMPKLDHTEIVGREYDSALTQLGTLGGGNHFIEIQKDGDNNVWIMLHSGSRNIGNKVATYYNKLALEMNKKWASGIPDSWELNFLTLDSQEGKDYFKDMQYCLEFALANRKLMMDNIKDVFVNKMREDGFKFELHPNHYFEPMINIHHNYAAIETHFGEDVVVHRKGATKALPGLIGIIPGSQGTCSYIVEGLGNPDSFMSCSHGAGRKMGRRDACRRLNLEEEMKKLNDKGIVHGIRSAQDLDEATGAYKDIDVVMANQSDLVKILTKLEPMAVVKG